MSALILPILLFVVFYFVLIRPQNRKMKEQKALVSKAAAGDRVMLASGIYGTITEVVDTAVYLELAEGLEILVNRAFIQEILDHFPTEAAALEESDDDMDDGDMDEEADDDMDEEANDDMDDMDDDIQDEVVDDDADEVDA